MLRSNELAARIARAADPTPSRAIAAVPELRAISRLRRDTADAHRAVEENLLARRIARPDATPTDLLAFLAAQLAVLEAWRSSCPAFIRAGSGIDPDTIERLDALNHDLRALGAEPASRCVEFPRWPASSSRWWGALYVIEGSRLGGHVIARQLRSNPALSSLDCFRFLDARPTQSWPNLLRAIDARLNRTDDIDAAVTGALATFALYAEAFNRP